MSQSSQHSAAEVDSMKQSLITEIQTLRSQLDCVQDYLGLRAGGAPPLSLGDQVQERLDLLSRGLIEQAVQAAQDAIRIRLDSISYEAKTQTEQLKEVRLQVSSINQRVEQKASYQNVRNLEQALQEYAKISNVQLLHEVVDTKASSVDFKRMNADFKLHQMEFDDLKSRFGTSVDSQHRLQDTSKDIQAQMEARFKLIETEIQKHSLEQAKRTEKVGDVIKDFQTEVGVKVVDLIAQISTRSTLEDISLIRQDLQQYATHNSVRELRRELLPEVRQMKVSVLNYSQENEQMKEMIRRFDEVLADKASKSQLAQVQYEVEEAFVKKKYWERLQQEINETMIAQQATMKLMQESVKTFEKTLAEEIDLAVKKGLTKYMVNYEKVLQQFSKFFDQEELQKIIDRKADILLVQNVQDIKASKQEVEECHMLIEGVHERLKHLSIVQVEIARQMIPQKTPTVYNKDEAINQKISRREFLLKQAQVTSQWVVDQPLKVEEIHLPQDPSGTNEGAHDSSFFDQAPPQLISSLQAEEIPITIKQFEKYHNALTDHLNGAGSISGTNRTPEIPQTVKRWKKHLMAARQSKSVNQATMPSYYSSNNNPQTNIVFLDQHKKNVKANANANSLLKQRRSSNGSIGGRSILNNLKDAQNHTPVSANLSPKENQQIQELLTQQRNHFMQILQASKGDFAGAVAGLLGSSEHNNSTTAKVGGDKSNNNHFDSLIQDDASTYHNVNFSASASVAAGSGDRNAYTSASGQRRVMVFNKNQGLKGNLIGKFNHLLDEGGQKPLGSSSNYTNSKLFLNRYQGKINNDGSVAATPAGNIKATSFDAHVIINGSASDLTQKQARRTFMAQHQQSLQKANAGNPVDLNLGMFEAEDSPSHQGFKKAHSTMKASSFLVGGGKETLKSLKSQGNLGGV